MISKGLHIASPFQHILMTCVPYFFTEQQAINTSPSCVCEEHRDPNCTTSMVPVSPSRRVPRRHPPPPLEANTHAADAVPLLASNSSGGPNGAHRFIVIASSTHIVVVAMRINGHINSNCHRPWLYGGKHSSLKVAIR